MDRERGSGGRGAEPVVDYGRCNGCGACVELCPGVFELRDDKAWVVDPAGCGACDCGRAVVMCPQDAISLA
ncbi:ferredoxin [Dissulfurirhabdus thermomarina]|uniref:Ferredoxin n=1 Tax=Dissulfurirhabdus thermomarina TaxID=1765737 RepID=A0A6N9TJR9_DISTH|nr:ferredoxin [Dissulfurirhabdus thermomarina]NDY41495.1 ferredoxin [Dissulfurirhabdus thermomarina]NMX23878.1 4Fe-4S binding protein [Dissulfurirhabdus thermomarina]